MKFKAPDNTLHVLEDVSFLHLLPSGSVQISDEEYEQIYVDQNKPEKAQLESQLVAAIQLRLDNFARERNYDTILSACTYATSAVPKFKREGQTCVDLRDATWAAAYQILAEVQAGIRPMPESVLDIEADLPAAEWKS